MDFYELPAYKRLQEALDNHRKLNANLLIITVPGAGTTYFLKKYLEKKKGKDLTYIDSPDLNLESFNLLDFDFDSNTDSLTWVDNYLRTANTSQKFAVVINVPYMLDTHEFAQSYVGKHSYRKYYFGFHPIEIVVEMNDRLKAALTKKEIEKVWGLTGGLGGWVKFFLINKSLLQTVAPGLIENVDLVRIVKPTAEIIGRCSDLIRKNLSITKNGVIQSGILVEYYKKFGLVQHLDLLIKPDLSLIEDGKLVSKLIKVEADILQKMISNNGVITKEDVATRKWGEESYDNYSDQAVGKTMRRLAKKMGNYQIRAITGYGFKLEKK